MTDPQPADSPPDADRVSAARPPRTPHWVKVFAAVALLVVLLFVVVLVVRGPGGRHGPERHLGRDDTSARQTPRSSPGGDARPGQAPRGRPDGHAPGEHSPPPGIPDHGQEP